MEIDGLRRGLGEPDRGRIPPHLTLVPPVNVREVDDAHAVVRAGAHSLKPFDVELGPVSTFLPDNPVAYLSIGAGAESVHRLRNAVFRPPLARELTWPFVPHVTVADGIEPGVVAAAPVVLGQFRKTVTVRSVALLEEQGRRWLPVATYPLGPPAVIGRGGQALEIDVVDIDNTVVLTAFRDGGVVGVERGWRRGGHAWLSHIEVDDAARRDGIGTHLLAAFESWAASHESAAGLVDPALRLTDDARAFLTARGWAV